MIYRLEKKLNFQLEKNISNTLWTELDHKKINIVVGLRTTDCRKLVGIATGHCLLIFAAKIGLSSSKWCEHCDADEESVSHIHLKFAQL